MKILIPVKRVIDPGIAVRVDPGTLDVMRENIPHAMNPFDETALSEASRFKKECPNLIDEIIAVSIGPLDVEETLRTALAMGADRAIHVSSQQILEPLAIAKILKMIVDEIEPDLILMGKQAADLDNGQVGAMLAGLLGRPQACNASKILMDPRQVPDEGFGSIGPGMARMLLSHDDDENEGLGRVIIVTREVEEGKDSIILRLPAVITCDLRLNDPQPPGLAAVMQAKKQTIEQRSAADCPGIDQPHLEILRIFEPPSRAACKILDDAEHLVTELKQRDVL